MCEEAKSSEATEIEKVVESNCDGNCVDCEIQSTCADFNSEEEEIEEYEIEEIEEEIEEEAEDFDDYVNSDEDCCGTDEEDR